MAVPGPGYATPNHIDAETGSTAAESTMRNMSIETFLLLRSGALNAPQGLC